MIKILIADDHPVVRRGLKQILSEDPGMTVVGEAQNFQEVQQFIRQQTCDVLVLDLNMPGQGGLEGLGHVKVDWPKLPVLIVSVHPEDQFAVRVLKAGAAGYLTKESAPEQLVAAVRKVYGGGKYISPTLAEQLAEALQPAAGRPVHEALADREYQVLCLIASGKTVSEIADYLTLSVKTVSTYRTRILEKMNLRTNAELTYYAIRNGLVK